jgi:hypothetical protein
LARSDLLRARLAYVFSMQGPNTFSLPVGVLSKFGMPIERLCARAGLAPSNAWVTSDFFRICGGRGGIP